MSGGLAMHMWKVVKNASVGIVTVVALPVAGPVGSISMLGAMVAGTIGIGIGAMTARSQLQQKQAEATGEQKAAAHYALKYAKIVESCHAINKQIEHTDHYFQLILALETVGLACAHSDGIITPQERKEINQFIAGITSIAFPAHIQQQIDAIAANPPTIKTAFAVASQLVTNTEKISYALFNDLIHIVIHVDKQPTSPKKAFQQAWNELVLTATKEDDAERYHVQAC